MMVPQQELGTCYARDSIKKKRQEVRCLALVEASIFDVVAFSLRISRAYSPPLPCDHWGKRVTVGTGVSSFSFIGDPTFSEGTGHDRLTACAQFISAVLINSDRSNHTMKVFKLFGGFGKLASSDTSLPIT